MAYDYYLVNGTKGKGNALNIPVDNLIYRNFKDISSIDLQTMNIKKKDAANYFKEYNKDININGMFYIASYPHKKKDTKTYAPIFDIASDNTREYFDLLREYAEKRDYQSKNNMNLKLELDKKLNDLIKDISYDILQENNSRLLSYESLIASDVKDIYKQKFTDYPNKGTNQYIDSRIYLLRNYLTNYTQLRNIILEYISYKEYGHIVRRTVINEPKGWDNEGFEKIEPYLKDKPRILCKQMTLDQFIDMN